MVSHPSPNRGFRFKLAELLTLRRRDPLEEGLRLIDERLGLGDPDAASKRASENPAIELLTHPTEQLARNIYYAPDMDGQADPGEVVWVMLQTTDGGVEDRPLLVVGRQRQYILGLSISPGDHPSDEVWLDIGSGPWEDSGKPCAVRTDEVVEVPESSIRRQGAIMPRRRFERAALMLRSSYGWG